MDRRKKKKTNLEINECEFIFRHKKKDGGTPVTLLRLVGGECAARDGKGRGPPRALKSHQLTRKRDHRPGEDDLEVQRSMPVDESTIFRHGK